MKYFNYNVVDVSKVSDEKMYAAKVPKMKKHLVRKFYPYVRHHRHQNFTGLAEKLYISFWYPK